MHSLVTVVVWRTHPLKDNGRRSGEEATAGVTGLEPATIPWEETALPTELHATRAPVFQHPHEH